MGQVILGDDELYNIIDIFLEIIKEDINRVINTPGEQDVKEILKDTRTVINLCKNIRKRYLNKYLEIEQQNIGSHACENCKSINIGKAITYHQMEEIGWRFICRRYEKTILGTTIASIIWTESLNENQYKFIRTISIQNYHTLKEETMRNK